MTNEIERLRHIYSIQYNPDPQDRNYIWHPLNPTSIYFRQAQERAIAELFRDYYFNVLELRVLDVGCGQGRLLRFLASLGMTADHLYGIDLMNNRIEAAHKLAPPSMKLLIANAEMLPYPNQFFDLVTQFTVFSSILTAQLRQHIATEMIRVLKPNCHILWYDMYRGRSADLHYITLAEINELFPGFVIRGMKAMHPIRASQIARYSRFICEIWERLPGIPKTHYMVLLEKL